MSSPKEIGRRDFLKGAALFSLGQGCFLGRNSYDLKADAISMLAGGAVCGGTTAWFQIRESPEKEITRREVFSVIRNALGGAAIGLTFSELYNWRYYRQEKSNFLALLPPSPEKNEEITKLSLSELVDLINRFEGKIPTSEEMNALITATTYQVAQFLGETSAEAEEYARRMIGISKKEEFLTFCNPDAFACTVERAGGKIYSFFDLSEGKWEELLNGELPILSLVRATVHEVAHMNIRQLEIFLRSCGFPKEDYGVLGEYEVVLKRGFLRNFLVPGSEDLTLDGLVEEEFFAEWAAFRFLNRLKELGLEKMPFFPGGYPEFFQAIINLESPDSDWPKLWQGAMDFSRVAKLHRESDLWSLRRGLGKVYSSYIEPPVKLEEGNLAALGKLVFEAFSKTDAERLKKFLQIKSEKDLVSL